MARFIINDGSDDNITVKDRATSPRYNRFDRPRRVRSMPYMQRSPPYQQHSGPRTPVYGFGPREPEPNEGFVPDASPFESVPDHSVPMYRYPPGMQMPPPMGPYPHIPVYPPPGWFQPAPGPPFLGPPFAGPGPFPYFGPNIPPPPLPQGPNIPPTYNPMIGPPPGPRPQLGPPPAARPHFNPFEPRPQRYLGGPDTRPRDPPAYALHDPRNVPITPVDLSEHPRDVIFATEETLLQRLVSTYRPLVGVVGRVVTEKLRLRQRPGVKFDMYAVRVNAVTGGVST